MLADLGINGWQLLIQLIAFIVFIALLWKFAVGPITRVLDERQLKIRESMEAAERMQAELKDTQARNEQVLQEARREAQDIVSTARTNGDQPDIFMLSFGSVDVFYTVEPVEVMIRGYGWQIDHEPLDDYDGGGFYAEASW